jgi:hypothetical protein
MLSISGCPQLYHFLPILVLELSSSLPEPLPIPVSAPTGPRRRPSTLACQLTTAPFIAGPVAQNVKEQHAKTSAELANLAASRQTPANPAATGQPLTHYHSFFSELLSWKNPRKLQTPESHQRCGPENASNRVEIFGPS